MPARPYRITAVCLGNICRSPIAEAVLRDRLDAAGFGDVVVDSAGTGDWHVGYPADSRARATLLTHDYSLDGHTARQITPEWFADMDLILAMDSSNFTTLQAMADAVGATPDLHMLRAFDPGLAHLPQPHPELDVPDPYYGEEDGFSDVLRMIERASEGLMAQLPARLGR